MASFLITPFLSPDTVNIANCSWIKVFDNDERNYYHQGLVVTGVLSEIFLLWLNLTLMCTLLWKDVNYRHFALFTGTACLRRLSWGLISLPTFRHLDRITKSNLLPCVTFAQHDCFFSVLELEGLTHVCIDRYVMARYAANKWRMDKPFSYLYMVSTLMFALVYTFIPSFRYGGSFNYDLSCTTCGVNMLLPNNYQRFIVLTLFFMRSVKPVLVMTSSLARAYYLDSNVCTDPEAEQRKRFTRNLIILTAVTLLSWLPLGVIRGYVIFGQLFYDKRYIIDSMAGFGETINSAMFLYWASPVFMAITAMLVDKNIRYNMINLFASAKLAAEIANQEDEKTEKERTNEIEKPKEKKSQ
ncbi:uncharacterized protein LOC128671751 [Plodia interpunctella]|uniref:uncharacterized protein LOC128671751 n=1 Tax=Plodia interpunctella TaxID=58824 RepID=UPI0023684CCC|nr:uncharacterized protein LOC128671751 [Plodia interpunctella]